MTTVPNRSEPRDHGFTLVEIVIAIVLVGILSAVVVVGIGQLTSEGTDAACSASQDAARAGATVHFASSGSYPATFSAMTASSSLALPSGASVDGTGRQLVASGWTLHLVPGASGAAPRFVCGVGIPSGFTVGPTGNFYRLVTTPATWSDARTAATAFQGNGSAGYLATITSAAEHTFIRTLTGGEAWLGGSDEAVEGTWRWVVGPEAGQHFSNGASSVGGAYVNWNVGEPSHAHEDCLVTIGSSTGPWNDSTCSGTRAYVVEITGA